MCGCVFGVLLVLFGVVVQWFDDGRCYRPFFKDGLVVGGTLSIAPFVLLDVLALDHRMAWGFHVFWLLGWFCCWVACRLSFVRGFWLVSRRFGAFASPQVSPQTIFFKGFGSWKKQCLVDQIVF